MLSSRILREFFFLALFFGVWFCRANREVMGGEKQVDGFGLICVCGIGFRLGRWRRRGGGWKRRACWRIQKGVRRIKRFGACCEGKLKGEEAKGTGLGTLSGV